MDKSMGQLVEALAACLLCMHSVHAYVEHMRFLLHFPDASVLKPACCLQELSIYGKLRKVSNCGPVSMFRSLLVTWKGRYPPHVIAQRVKDFFRYVMHTLCSDTHTLI